ncbi:hypothetical protein ACF0H5_006278 [Mactra antiquata]
MDKQSISPHARTYNMPYLENTHLLMDCQDCHSSMDSKLDTTNYRSFIESSVPIWYVRGDIGQTNLCSQMVGQGLERLNTVRRKPVIKDNTGALKLWLLQHKRNPYPNKPEKIMLAILSKMTLTQVSTWFANARRRLKKEYPDEEFELITDPLQQNQHFNER